MQAGHGSYHNLRIVLLGKTGAGKSASGNTIMGLKVFEENAGFGSVTNECKTHFGEVASRQITVVDIPGLFDTRKTGDELKSEIEKCVESSCPGPHVFLLVIRLGVRFTEEERNAVKWIQENFGERAAQFTMVLFTHADQLNGMLLEDAVKYSEIQDIIKRCGGGYHVFSNKEKEDQTQVNKLLEKIESMVEKNGGEYYTNQMYQETQEKIREEEERKRQEEERKRKEYEDKIREEEKKMRVKAEKIAEEERKKREKAEKIAEEERKKREEAEKIKNERKKREKAEKIAEEERKKREEAEKIAEEEGKKREEAEKIEKERKKREKAEKIAEEERKKREKAEKIAEEERKKRAEAKKKQNVLTVGMVGGGVSVGVVTVVGAPIGVAVGVLGLVFTVAAMTAITDKKT